MGALIKDTNILFMKDKSYKRYKYNLSDDIAKELAKIKENEKETYNLVFKKLIKTWKEETIIKKI